MGSISPAFESGKSVIHSYPIICVEVLPSDSRACLWIIIQFYLIHGDSHQWSPEPKGKKCDFPKAAMLWGSQATEGGGVKVLQLAVMVFKSSSPRCQICERTCSQMTLVPSCWVNPRLWIFSAEASDMGEGRHKQVIPTVPFLNSCPQSIQTLVLHYTTVVEEVFVM